MIKLLQFALGLICLAGVAQAQEDAPVKTPASYEVFYKFSNKINHQAHTLSIDKFKSLTKDPKVIVADLRSKESYDYQHIKGAIHLGSDISIEALEKIAASKETVIIFYCTNSLMPTRMVSQTHMALPQALYLGYKNIYVLQDAAESDVSGRIPMEATAVE